MSATAEHDAATDESAAHRLWVERLSLTGFRTYASAALELGPEPVVLTGPNGSGKTNVLEAVSLLAPGQGLRQAPLADLAKTGGDGSWSVAARVHTAVGPVTIGTGRTATERYDNRPAARLVRIDGEPKSGSGALADYVEMVWITPATDGLFTGPAAFSTGSSFVSIPVTARARTVSSARWRSAIASCPKASRAAPSSTGSSL